VTKAATRHKAENRVGSVKPYKDIWRGRATVSLLSGEPKRLQVYGKTYSEARERLDKEIRAAQKGTLNRFEDYGRGLSDRLARAQRRGLKAHHSDQIS
jgi:hypothetical protein